PYRKVLTAYWHGPVSYASEGWRGIRNIISSPDIHFILVQSNAGREIVVPCDGKRNGTCETGGHCASGRRVRRDDDCVVRGYVLLVRENGNSSRASRKRYIACP